MTMQLRACCTITNADINDQLVNYSYFDMTLFPRTSEAKLFDMNASQLGASNVDV